MSAPPASSLLIGVLLGSCRVNGNAAGLLAFVQQRWRIVSARLQTQEGGSPALAAVAARMEIKELRLPAPLGPVVDPVMAAMHVGKIGWQLSGSYENPAVRDWSSGVRSCVGLIFLSPQYNWGMPGELKNSLDHLYYEWRVAHSSMIVTYGGHGGGKCADNIRNVCVGGLKMNMLPVENDVRITLPKEFIQGDMRVQEKEFEGDEATIKTNSAFLNEYAASTDIALEQLAIAVMNGINKA